jgi:hypothetical protein
MNNEIEALVESLQAMAGLDRLHLPEPAGPPRPAGGHPLAGFYRLPRAYGGEEEKLPEAASAGRYL